MSDLGDLLELLHLATTRTRSIHATIAEWEAPRLWEEAGRRFRELLPETMPQVSSTIGARKPDDLPESREGVHRVWRRYPGNFWLIESTSYLGDTYTVRNEKKWWHTDARGSLTTNDRHGRTTWGLSVHGERFIEMMFDPSSLLAFASFELAEVGEELIVAGRPAIAAVAHWRAGVDLLAVDWPYADSTELLVDSEHGILLRMEFLLDRTPFIRWTVEEVAFNEVMPDSLFERI